MEKLTLDTGIKEYQINDGVLRFNPADPNVYARFLDMQKRLDEIADESQKRLSSIDTEGITDEEAGILGIEKCKDLDAELKALFSHTFGEGNNFDEILGGVSFFAISTSGRWVVEELLLLLQPIVNEGAQSCLKRKANAAVQQAEMNRAQRRADQK